MFPDDGDAKARFQTIQRKDFDWKEASKQPPPRLTIRTDNELGTKSMSEVVSAKDVHKTHFTLGDEAPKETFVSTQQKQFILRDSTQVKKAKFAGALGLLSPSNHCIVSWRDRREPDLTNIARYGFFMVAISASFIILFVLQMCVCRCCRTIDLVLKL